MSNWLRGAWGKGPWGPDGLFPQGTTLKDQIGEAIGLGLGMLAGEFVGFLLFTPIVGGDREEDTIWSIIGIAVGTVAGAVGWKIYAAYHPYPPPESGK